MKKLSRAYNIWNEAQYDIITTAAKFSGLKAKITDYKTKIVLIGTEKQFERFDDLSEMYD